MFSLCLLRCSMWIWSFIETVLACFCFYTTSPSACPDAPKCPAARFLLALTASQTHGLRAQSMKQPPPTPVQAPPVLPLTSANQGSHDPLLASITCQNDSQNSGEHFAYVTATAAKSLQLCPTLCDPIDGSPPGFPVPGILQARTLEWVAISFSSA